jgi:hypothetical protein
MRPSTTPVIACGLALVLAACGASRAGWGKGRWHELHESGELQIRRGPIGVDPTTGELVLAWIGARVPEGIAGEIERCDLVVYADRDGDREPDADEAVSARRAPQPGVRIQFDDVRVTPHAERGRLWARLDVRSGRVERSVRVELVPDP